MTFLLLLFLAATVGLFYAGLKNPALQKLSVVPAILAIGVAIFSMKPVKAPELEEIVLMDEVLGQMFAEKILQKHPGGGAVAVIQLRPGDPDIVMQEIPEAQLRGLKEILGEKYTIILIDATRIGSEDSSRPQGELVRFSRDFQAMLKDVPDVVAVVSFAGLPADPYKLRTMNLPPVYGLMEDVLPPEWQNKLPQGIAGVASIRADGDFQALPDPEETSLELFEKKYIFTP